MFDFMKLLQGGLSGLTGMGGGQQPGPDAGWGAGTSVTPEGSAFSQGLDGNINGLSGLGKGVLKGVGSGMTGAAAMMPGGQGFAQMLANGGAGGAMGAFGQGGQQQGEPQDQATANFIKMLQQRAVQRNHRFGIGKINRAIAIRIAVHKQRQCWAGFN